jgi:hypothetical protein
MSAINNLVIYDDPDPRYVSENTFDIGVSVRHGMVAHNTVWNPAKTPASSFAVCKTDYTFSNNLYFNGTVHRCAAQAHNLQFSDSTWFVDVAGGDFRPSENRPAPGCGVPDDITGTPRAGTPSAGAFEWQPNVGLDQPFGRQRYPEPQMNYRVKRYDLHGRTVDRYTMRKHGARGVVVARCPAGSVRLQTPCRRPLP